MKSLHFLQIRLIKIFCPVNHSVETEIDFQKGIELKIRKLEAYELYEMKARQKCDKDGKNDKMRDIYLSAIVTP